MLGRMGKDAGSLLGVEIASDSVRVLQLRRLKGRYERVAWALERFEPFTAGDWWQAPDRVLAALSSAYRRSGSRQRRVAVALPASQVICKLWQLPPGQSEADLEAKLLADADRLFPFPLEELVMDFQVMGASQVQAGARDVMVAACRQAVLTPWRRCSRRPDYSLKRWRSTASLCGGFCLSRVQKARRCCDWSRVARRCIAGHQMYCPSGAKCPWIGCASWLPVVPF